MSLVFSGGMLRFRIDKAVVHLICDVVDFHHVRIKGHVFQFKEDEIIKHFDFVILVSEWSHRILTIELIRSIC